MEELDLHQNAKDILEKKLFKFDLKRELEEKEEAFIVKSVFDELEKKSSEEQKKLLTKLEGKRPRGEIYYNIYRPLKKELEEKKVSKMEELD